jgi:radical SAM protein with 4Fe4S-binding SPASM domain
MDAKFLPKGFWLTVNRVCNLRCRWCYAKGAKFTKETMELGLAKDIVDFMNEHEAKQVILLGGEPTLYPDLMKLIKHCQQKKMDATIVTNGLKLSDEAYLDSLVESGVKIIAVSLKGSSEANYKEQTGRLGFKKVIKGLALADKKGVRLDLSTVLSKTMRAKEAIELIKALEAAGQTGMAITSCIPSVTCNSIENNSGYRLDEVAKDYLEIVEETANLKIKVFFFIALPFCLFPKDFISDLKKENRLLSGCQLVRREGVIYGLKGEVLICNSLYDFPIGSFQRLSTSNDYLGFWNNEKINELYQSFYRYPVEQCATCQDWIECGGGCPLKWLDYSPSDYALGERR